MHGSRSRVKWATWSIVAILAIANVVWIGLCNKVVEGEGRQSKTPSSPQSLQFTTASVQVGEIRTGRPLTCQFAFANRGKKVVEVVEVRPGCGCLKPRLDQRRFAPGQRGVLPLEVQTLGQAAGPHTWHVTVLYREGEGEGEGSPLREQALEVSGTVVTEVSVQPAALTLVTEGGISQEVTVTDLRTTPLKIVGVESSSAQVQVEASPFARDASGNFTSKVTVQASNELEPGRHDEFLVIHTTDPEYSEFKIPVTVVKQVSRRITATPAEVTVHSTALVRLRDQQDQPVVVECVTSDRPNVICQWAPGPEHQATVKLKLNAKQSGGPGSATVRVQLSSPVREVVTIAVRWVDE